jgi:hypothetical protein
VFIWECKRAREDGDVRSEEEEEEENGSNEGY